VPILENRVSEERPPSLLESVLRSRRTFIVYVGSALVPLECVAALWRGNGILAAIFALLAIVMWIELAAARGLDVAALRWLETSSSLLCVLLYLYYVIFRWREFLIDGF
jgi:hypothetical protein